MEVDCQAVGNQPKCRIRLWRPPKWPSRDQATVSAKTELLTDLVHNNEEQKLQFLPGFIAGKDENFRGRLPGVVFNFDYVKAAKAMSGRFYYLRANDNTVYVIRFTGFQDSMRLAPRTGRFDRTDI